MNLYVPDTAHNILIEEIMSPISADGEIVGVIGEWGTGKTTLANNALRAVEDCKEVYSQHINLWMVEHHSEVEDIFFEVLAKELKVRNFESLSNLFFEYSLTLKHAGTKIEKLEP